MSKNGHASGPSDPERGHAQASVELYDPGLKGPADKDETDTRRACVDLAKSHMGIPDASAFDYSACHRLSRKENVGIIDRSKDLQQLKEWLANVNSLKSKSVSLQTYPLYCDHQKINFTEEKRPLL